MFPSLIEDTNILVLMNQLSGGKESDERRFTRFGAAITNYPSNESEMSKTKTMLIHGAIFRNIFPKMILG